MRYLHKNMIFKQRGFSLIEALVAFLILSVGMLGIASLQLLSLKAGHTAVLRTIAVIKAEEMFERIRNNPVVLDPATVGSSYAVLAGDLGTSHSCNDSSGAVELCNYIQIAQDDIFNWKESLKNSLPNNAGTTASIDVVAKIPGTLPVATVTITINWQERGRNAQGEPVMTPMSYIVSAHICDNTKC